MLTNLPILPEEDVNNGYVTIKKFAQKKRMFQQFCGVFRYFESYWIQQQAREPYPHTSTIKLIKK